MKRILHISVTLAFLIALLPMAAFAHTEDAPSVTDLIADGGSEATAIVVGNVSVWNGAENLYVKYEITEPDWCLTKTHLHVADSLANIPQTKKGNPKPGQFEYKMDHNCVGDYTYAVDVSAWPLNTLLYIAAHAGVERSGSFMLVSGANTESAGWFEMSSYDGTTVDPAYALTATNYSGGGPWQAAADISSPDAAWYDENLVPGANWVSSIDGREGSALNDQWRLFREEFSVPDWATDISGTLSMTADNALAAYLESAEIGATTHVYAEATTPPRDISVQFFRILHGTFSFEPDSGANTLNFVVRNYYGTGSNPTALLYKATVEFSGSETAWGAGERFVEKGNWATFFEYEVQGPKVIAGWDTERGGSYSLNHADSLQARSDLEGVYADLEFRALPDLTISNLGDVDVVVLSSVKGNSAAIVPLTVAEQDALETFVDGGGCAILLPDNSAFGGAGSDPANESLIDPFELDISGNLTGSYSATVSTPWSSETSYVGNYTGWFDGTSTAVILATLDATAQPSLVEFAPDSFVSGSGRVVVYSDANVFFGGSAGRYSSNAQLFLDTVDACFQP